MLNDLINAKVICRVRNSLRHFCHLLNCIEERPWRPMQSPNTGRKEKVEG